MFQFNITPFNTNSEENTTQVDTKFSRRLESVARASAVLAATIYVSFVSVWGRLWCEPHFSFYFTATKIWEGLYNEVLRVNPYCCILPTYFTLYRYISSIICFGYIHYIYFYLRRYLYIYTFFGGIFLTCNNMVY